MLLKFLVGVLKMELHIGFVLTHGMKIGETKDSSKSKEEIMNAELKEESLLDYQNYENIDIFYYFIF